MFTSVVLLGLVLVGIVSAQCAPTNGADTIVISSQADADALKDCGTVSASITISPELTGKINIDGPTQLDGDLIAHSSGGLISLSSTSISTIGGTLDLFNLTLLSTLQFEVLNTVAFISFISLPALSATTFPSSLDTVDVTIANTFLSVIPAIDEVANLNINNNRRLAKISLPLKNAVSINIAANSPSTALSLPNLVWVGNFTAQTDLASLSLQSLAIVNESFSLVNTGLSGFSVPNLSMVGDVSEASGSFVINNNTALRSLVVPLLSTVGGSVQVTANDDLGSLNFPDLKTVAESVVLTGNFSTPSFGSLEDVNGELLISSSEDIDCTSISKLAHSVVSGKVVCEAKQSSPSGSIPLDNSTSTETSSSSSITTSTSAPVMISTTSAGTATTSASPTTSSSATPTSSSAAQAVGSKNRLGVTGQLISVMITFVVFA